MKGIFLCLICVLFLLQDWVKIIISYFKRLFFLLGSFDGLRNGWKFWFFCFFFLMHLFIYFWLHRVFAAARGLSLVAASGGNSSLWCAGCSSRWLLLLRSTGFRHMGFSSCGSPALERRLSSCGSWALERRLSSCGTRA